MALAAHDVSELPWSVLNDRINCQMWHNMKRLTFHGQAGETDSKFYTVFIQHIFNHLD